MKYPAPLEGKFRFFQNVPGRRILDSDHAD
jgi:hypothetical protein